MVNLIIQEHDGLDSRSFCLTVNILDETLVQPNKESIRNAVTKACNEYVRTDAGKKTYIYNCRSFNWADFASEVPVSICKKYGFEIINSETNDIEFDWDEHLITDEPEYEEDEI